MTPRQPRRPDPPGRLVSLAAGTVLDATPQQVVRAAADAGYGGVGLRLDPSTSTHQAATLRSLLTDHGLVLLDLEVVRLETVPAGPDPRRLLDLAHALGARHLLTVSTLPDREVAVEQLHRLSSAAADSGVRIALEFMRFTRIRSLSEALAILDDAEAQEAVVVVDALHLHRSGEQPADVAAAPAHRIGYLQLCDAPDPGPVDEEQLATEARHHRLLPGDGELPLAALVASAPPVTPISVEVQSDHLTAISPPPARATLLRERVRELLPTG